MGKAAQIGFQFCWSWAARLVCILSDNIFSARANQDNADLKSDWYRHGCVKFSESPFALFNIKFKITPHKLSILSTVLTWCCTNNFSRVFKDTLPLFPWHWSTCSYTWDGFRHMQHSAQACVFSWAWAVNYIVSARNAIIILGSKALNMRNHKVRAITSYFRVLQLLILLHMKIKGYFLSFLVPSKSGFGRSGSVTAAAGAC